MSLSEREKDKKDRNKLKNEIKYKDSLIKK